MLSAKIACVGGGNMGRALLASLLRAGVPAAQLTVSDPLAPTRETLARELGIRALADNRAAIDGARLVILAVKPQEAAATLQPLRSSFQANKSVLLSIAAGLRCADLASWSGCDEIIRAMPNRPALVGVGATALYAPIEVSPAARKLATDIMHSAGEVVWLDDENLMDPVTALSGSGPAYFFLLAEVLAAAGVEQGLSANDARRLAIATLHGAGVMAAQSDGDLVRLRDEVTSKGGTTAAALTELQGAQGLRQLLARAVAAGTRRARELGSAK